MKKLASLTDDLPADRPYTTSPRLAVVLSKLPKYNRARITNALSNAGIRTLAGLCAKTRRDLRKCKNVGKKCVTDLETLLTAFGLSLATTSASATPTPRHRHQDLPVVEVDFSRSISIDRDRPRIYLVLNRPNGHRSAIEVSGEPVNPDMLASAEDLLYTLTTGERPPIEGLYEACALAFGTTRGEAKKRLVGAMYGKRGEAVRR